MSTTVLVVEDDLEINELLGEYLGLENIKYLQATTGEAGIHQARTVHPDAVILDLMLPDVHGFEVARALTTKRATYDVPVIILSCMCQPCDQEKGYGSGALFYMNKPFLPDDLLATLKRALEWKETIKTRVPAGTIVLGGKDPVVCARGTNEMVADIFSHSDLTDAAVAGIREAIETLGQWAAQWNTEHKTNGQLRVEYRVGQVNGGPAVVEWKLSESEPGLLADAFFKPQTTVQKGGILGWGGSSLITKPVAPIAPPAKWLAVLAKTGAAKFEKDSKTQVVRFARNAVDAAGTLGPSVPVVEVDGMRYPTRLRDEALAAKRK